MSQKVRTFPPIRPRHLTGRDVDFAFLTESCVARGLLSGCVFAYYRGGVHGAHHSNNFVSVDVAALACPFPSALACVLSSYDAFVPLHYRLMRLTSNDLVYALCAIPCHAQASYRE